MALVVVSAVWIGWGERARPVGLAEPRVRIAIPEAQALPGVQPPVEERRVDRDTARELNAAVPFAAVALSPAPPFRFAGSLSDRARAADCLAIAAMAEAGGGETGQRAVIQVVLNRVLHPAFAKTICGVVFEGSHRATGCQFTFTCDGALARRYGEAAWAQARGRAFEALDGWVEASVGLATHYHTDWVHPYWSDSLVKLARVDTHLFFRWAGYWGNAAALSANYRGGEPAIAQLAYLPAHVDATNPTATALLADGAVQDEAADDVVVRNVDGGAFVVLAQATSATAARATGRAICSDRPSCKVFGWFDRSLIPAGYPVSASARAQLAFSYFRDARSDEIVLYDCARFAEVAADACIPSAMARRAALRERLASAPLETTLHPTAFGGDGGGTDQWRSAVALAQGGLAVVATR